MSEYLAHSARGSLPAQTYAEHVGNVAKLAARFAREAEQYSDATDGALASIAQSAALLHDLGKLDDANQAILRGEGSRGRLPVNHVDAGCAELLTEERPLAALAVYSHHRGLPDMPAELVRGGEMLRDAHPAARAHTRATLPELLCRHGALISGKSDDREIPPRADRAMFFRMALSCLADADHSDTAAAYGDALCDEALPELRAEERLAALDRYVSKLGGEGERGRLRRGMYAACRDAATDAAFTLCDSPVGSGKTTAVMAHALRQAITHRSRRVFVVLPYTNIIQQSVAIYREALTLPGEDSERVVAELHFRADYPDRAARHLTALWRAPIIVTTAVAFFGTLSACAPAALRRLHELPGSVILLDEAHCALPLKLLPLAWRWMNVLARDWGCRWVLASGSLVRYWELKNLAEVDIPRPEIASLVSGELRARLSKYERDRVAFCFARRAFSRRELVERVWSKPGPRLLIVNTVQTAAVLANDFCERYGRARVEHLSTALTPEDRGAAIERVRARLNDEDDVDWVLVATSCVEAGVDLSFRTGFRELASLLSLLQSAGRVGRHGEFEDAEMWSFRLRDDSMLTENPELENSRAVLAGYLDGEAAVAPELSTRAMDDELTVNGGMTLSEIRKFLGRERRLQLRELAENFDPIEGDTVPAVIDPALARDIARGEGDWRQLQRHSISIRRSKALQWNLPELLPGVYRWTLGYDPFLGYMRGVLDRGRSEHGGSEG